MQQPARPPQDTTASRPVQRPATTTTAITTQHFQKKQAGKPISRQQAGKPISRQQARPPLRHSRHHTSDKQYTPALSGSTVRPPTRSYCQHCKRSGHTENDCFRKVKCNYCQRYGHTIQECRPRLEYERQESLFKQLSAEQAKNNAWLLHSLTKNLSHSAPTQDLSGWTSQVGGLAPSQVLTPPPQNDTQRQYTPWQYTTTPQASYTTLQASYAAPQASYR